MITDRTSKSPPNLVGNECTDHEVETDLAGPCQNDTDEVDLINEARIAQPNLESKSPTVLLDQERYLPIANVVRIMKTQMDPQAKLAKDAKECVQECVSEFISFIASEAAAFCNSTKRKTITADDLLTALEATGFDNYAEPMRIFLMKYRQAHKITGPIHKPHVNYSRPKQFMNDTPVKPLFFDTDQGRRCTETQYVVNGCEVVKNAPLADEWNEKTGTLNAIVSSGVEKVYFEDADATVDGPKPKLRCIDHKEMQSSSAKDTEPNLPEGAIELEQQQQMQIYIDPTSKQHYAAMETPNGMELYPIMIQDTPLQLESVTDPNHILVHLSDGTTGTVSTTPIAPDSSSAKKLSGRQHDFRLKRMVKKRPNTRLSYLEEEANLVTTQQCASHTSSKRPLSKRKM